MSFGEREYESPFVFEGLGGGAPARPPLEQQTPPGQAFLPLSGRIVIGDSASPIQATRIDVFVSSRDVNPPAAGAFASAVSIILGSVTTAATQTSISVPVAQPEFSLMVPVAQPAAGTAQFSGFLIVRATWNHPAGSGGGARTRTARLPIDLRSGVTSPFRVVVLHPDNTSEYLWASVDVTRTPTTAPRNGTGTLTVKLRDQTTSRVPYRARFDVDARGRATIGTQTPVLFGIPRAKPALVRVAPGAAGNTVRAVSRLSRPIVGLLSRAALAMGRLYWPRADFFTFTAAQRTATPLSLGISPATVSTGMLAGQRLVLDPGHGVNYELTTQARVYEWFVAHQTLALVASAWQALGGDVVFVPTARFRTEHIDIGVDLTGVGVADPLAAGAEITLHIDRTRSPHSFEVEVADGRLGLRKLTAALGYNEDAGRDPFFTTYKRRAEFVTDYAAFLQQLEGRVTVPAGFSLVAGSTSWNAAQNRYEVTVEKVTASGTTRRQVALTIRRGDRFALLGAEVRFLATASILRSYRNEMEPAFRPVIGDASDPRVPSAALVDYAVRVLEQSEGRSLTPGGRQRFMGAQQGNVFVTAHQNAAGGHGVAVLVRNGTAVNDPAARTAKRFLKYLDPLNNGKHGSGIKFSTSTLVANPPSASNYAYLETDFMDTAEPSAPGGVRYGFMVDPQRFMAPAAEQIASTLIEMTLRPQADAEIDAADIGSPE